MNEVVPLHDRFPEWYGGLTGSQQALVRNVLVSLYHRDVAEALSRMFYLRDLEGLDESQSRQLMQEIDDFVAGGTLEGFLGEYVAELVAEDTTIQTFPDLLVKLTEVITPADGSASEYSAEMAENAGLPVEIWTKQALGNLSGDLKMAFPNQAEQFALEWQRKRTLLGGERPQRRERQHPR